MGPISQNRGPRTGPHLSGFREVWRDGWANLIPLVALLVVLFSGYTPYMSAFCGISLTVIAGAARRDVPWTLVFPAAFIAFVVRRRRRKRPA